LSKLVTFAFDICELRSLSNSALGRKIVSFGSILKLSKIAMPLLLISRYGIAVSHSEPEVSGRYQATIGTSLVTPKPQDNSRGPEIANYGD
jgi:hypothetical protein